MKKEKFKTCRKKYNIRRSRILILKNNTLKCLVIQYTKLTYEQCCKKMVSFHKLRFIIAHYIHREMYRQKASTQIGGG